MGDILTTWKGKCIFFLEPFPWEEETYVEHPAKIARCLNSESLNQF